MRCSARPRSGWEGGAREAGVDGNTAAGGHSARARRHLLLPALWALQERIGWISPGGLNEICRRLTVPPADAYGVATFYALFALEPRPPTRRPRLRGHRVQVSRLGGADRPSSRPASDRRASCRRTGRPRGFAAPAWASATAHPPRWSRSRATIPWSAPRRRSTRGTLLELLAGGEPRPSPSAPLPQAGDPSLRLLRRVGSVDPMSLDGYRAHGGYAALRRAFELGPEGVLREVRDSKLVGRGGAAFPTGVKWEAVARQPARPHYLVCNADESEPGTFKDRALHGGRPVRGRRGDDRRRVRDRLRAGVRLHPGRVPGSAPRARARPRRGSPARVPRATT